MSYRICIASFVSLCLTASTLASYASRHANTPVSLDAKISQNESNLAFSIPVKLPVPVEVSGPVYPKRPIPPPTIA
jgi:hypothetical protein